MNTLAYATMVVILSLATTVSSAFSCPTVPEMTEVMPGYDGIYSDASFSIIDKDKERYVLQLMKPIHNAHETLLKLSIDVLITANAEEAQCALNALQDWARRNTHTKVDSAQPTPSARQQSAYEMKWMLTSKALSYAYIKDYATPEQRKDIESWLIKIAERVISDTSPGATVCVQPSHLFKDG